MDYKKQRFGKVMNICYFDHYSVPPKYMGNRRTFDYAAKFVEFGHKVTIISSSFIHRTDINVLKNKEHIKTEKYQGVKYIWIRTFPKYQKNDYKRFLNMLSYLSTSQILQFKEKPDVIIGSFPTPFAALSGWLWSKKLGTKFVFEVRDLWPQVFIDLNKLKSSHPFVKFLYFLENSLYSKSDLVITSLPFALNYFKKRGFNIKKVVYIPNGINACKNIDKKIKSLPSSLLNIMNNLKSQNKKIVIYTGALAVYSGLDTILKAASLIENSNIKNKVAFVFVGDGSEKNSLLDLSYKLKLKNVFFHSSIPRDLILSLLNLADFAIFHVATSTYGQYGFNSNKLYDYLSVGIPVIFAAESPNDPVKESGCGISIPPQNPEAIVEAIKFLMNLSYTEIENMKKKGREYMLKYHDLNKLAHQYICTLERVIKNDS